MISSIVIILLSFLPVLYIVLLLREIGLKFEESVDKVVIMSSGHLSSDEKCILKRIRNLDQFIICSAILGYFVFCSVITFGDIKYLIGTFFGYISALLLSVVLLLQRYNLTNEWHKDHLHLKIN